MKTTSFYFVGLIYLIVTVVVATMLFCWSLATTQTQRSILLHLGTGTVIAEVADTTPARTQGLSDRPNLASDKGMLFVFPTANFYAFWMKDMRFPLDIIWLSEGGRVVGVNSNFEPASYPATITSPEPARYVLEVNAGWAKQHNVITGSLATVAQP